MSHKNVYKTSKPRHGAQSVAHQKSVLIAFPEIFTAFVQIEKSYGLQHRIIRTFLAFRSEVSSRHNSLTHPNSVGLLNGGERKDFMAIFKI